MSRGLLEALFILSTVVSCSVLVGAAQPSDTGDTGGQYDPLPIMPSDHCLVTGCPLEFPCCTRSGQCGNTPDCCLPEFGCIANCCRVSIESEDETDEAGTEQPEPRNVLVSIVKRSTQTPAAQPEGQVQAWPGADNDYTCDASRPCPPEYPCCSKWGYCGNGEAHCAPDRCISGCWSK